MKLDLNNVEIEAKWFEYDDDVEFKLKYISPEAGRRIRVKHTKKKWKKGVHEEVVNDDAYSDELADYIIADWKGIEVGDQPAPCTIEWKKKLLDASTDHARFIYNVAQDITNFIDSTPDEVLEENLENG